MSLYVFQTRTRTKYSASEMRNQMNEYKWGISDSSSNSEKGSGVTLDHKL